MKSSLSMALPVGCYGRIAPGSGLALKKFIDVVVGAIDSDYRGELGVILFNFGDEYFAVNMGDKIAQLIFEKIKTPVIKGTSDLGEIGLENKGYGSTRINEGQSESVQEFKLKESTSK